jgi:predicted small integral membrane protein
MMVVPRDSTRGLGRRPGWASALGAMLVSGWAVYVTVVVVSNVTDLMVSFKWIQTSFRSGNLAFIETATRIYFRSQPVDQALLAGVVIWEAGAAALLWYGAIAWYRSGAVRAAAAEAGLITLALLWMAFGVATEVFVAYDRGVNESAYWALAIAALATLLTLAHLGREAV